MIVIDTTLPGSAAPDPWSPDAWAPDTSRFDTFPDTRPHACSHAPRCPRPGSPVACQARVVVRHDEQGWCLLCNGVVLFDDGGAILPDGRVIAPAPPSPHAA